MTITRDMNLLEVTKKYPQSLEVFSAYGLGCTSCAIASMETIEEGAKAHRVDVDLLIEDLNYVLEGNN